MKKNQVILWYKRLVLSEQRLDELHSLISNNFQTIKYQAVVKSNATISFDSFEELKQFQNFGDEKICSLEIWGESHNSNKQIKMKFYPRQFLGKEVFSCSYTFTNVNEETLFVKELKSFLDRSTENQRVYIACEYISLIVFLIYPSLYISKQIIANTFNGSQSFSIVILALLSYKMLSFFVWNKLYPPVVYVLGEEKNRYNNFSNWRTNAFWSIFIAIIINLVAGFVGNFLFKALFP